MDPQSLMQEMLQASGDQRMAGLREGEGAVAMERLGFCRNLKSKEGFASRCLKTRWGFSLRPEL